MPKELKTHVYLSPTKHHGEGLITRSQAKRFLNQFDRFREVFLDFSGVDSIGQAFADEIFRVFKRSNPEVDIIAVNANPAVIQMINRAQSTNSEPSSPAPYKPAD